MNAHVGYIPCDEMRILPFGGGEGGIKKKLDIARYLCVKVQQRKKEKERKKNAYFSSSNSTKPLSE